MSQAYPGFSADSCGVKRDLIIEWNDDTIIKADYNTLTIARGFADTGNVRGICANGIDDFVSCSMSFLYATY